MKIPRVSTFVGGAVLSCTWMVYFLWNEPRASLLAVPLVGLGIAGLPRRPISSVALVAVGSVVTLWAGAAWGNVDLVLPLAIALFGAGRRIASVWVGGGLTAVCVLATALRASPRLDAQGIGDLHLDTVAISTVLFGSMWAFGRMVHHRSLRATDAVTAAGRLAAEDPALAGFRKVLEERARVADYALVTLRDAVLDMRVSATRTRSGLDQQQLRRIQARGAATVRELRGLLALLRAETGPGPEVSVVVRDRAEPRLVAVAQMTIAVALVTALLLTHPEWDRSWHLAVLYVGAFVALTVTRSAPATASFFLAAVTLLMLAGQPADPESLLPAAVVYAIFAWVVATDHRHRPVHLLAPGLAAFLVAVTHGHTAVGFIGIVFTLPFLAGLAWRERDRILRDAEAHGDFLQSRLDSVAATAIRDERLRLARELHDITGHAVGVMVVQAGAALALADRSPELAQEAVATVIAAADDALAEIEALFEALDASEFGISTRPRVGRGEFSVALGDLVRTVANDGREVVLRLGSIPATAAHTEIAYRVVQEALTNALRHSCGGVVTIQSSRAGSIHVVRVTDTGTATGATTGCGFGLAGLAERVQQCGGEFIASAQAPGFVVEARLPLDLLAVGTPAEPVR